MKQLIVVVLTLILLIACHVQQRAARAPAPPPPAATQASVQSPTPSGENPEQAALERSTTLLRELTLNPATSLPDAVLNATRCFVVGVPQRAQALSSCRTAAAPYDWSTPELMSLRGTQRAYTAVLILVISNRAATAISNGQLDLAAFKTAPGKTLSQTPLLSQRDLGYDVVTYTYADEKVTGEPLTAIIRRIVPVQRTEVPGGGEIETRQTPLSGEYVKWVTSYFNAITPTGIIIHHSAVIPAMGKVPRAVSQVDDYHAERGMDIECLGREYHVAYHYLIFPNGSVQAGRPERCEGAHARGYNSFVGISLVGDFSTADNPRGSKGPMKPTAQQMKSLIGLTRKLQQKYNIPLQRILRHSDVASTLCPGDRFAFKTFLAVMEQPRAR
jgi:N-acetylmuramoyl-L-alanine amidase